MTKEIKEEHENVFKKDVVYIMFSDIDFKNGTIVV